MGTFGWRTSVIRVARSPVRFPLVVITRPSARMIRRPGAAFESGGITACTWPQSLVPSEGSVARLVGSDRSGDAGGYCGRVTPLRRGTDYPVQRGALGGGMR